MEVSSGDCISNMLCFLDVLVLGQSQTIPSEIVMKLLLLFANLRLFLILCLPRTNGRAEVEESGAVSENRPLIRRAGDQKEVSRGTLDSQMQSSGKSARNPGLLHHHLCFSWRVLRATAHVWRPANTMPA